MARVNFEECYWTDPRRSLLIKKIGTEEMADGCMVKAWRLAQEFWRNERGLIPIELFETLSHFKEIIESKLADVRGEFVYVRGSSAYLDWVREAKEKAREAGKKSAEIRKQKYGSAQPKSNSKKENKENLELTPNNSRTPPKVPEPSDSVSDSGSIKEVVVVDPIVGIRENSSTSASTSIFKNSSLAAFTEYFENTPGYSRLKPPGAVRKIHKHYQTTDNLRIAYGELRAKYEKKKPFTDSTNADAWLKDCHSFIENSLLKEIKME